MQYFVAATVLVAIAFFVFRFLWHPVVSFNDTEFITDVDFISRTSDVGGSYFVRGKNGEEAVVPLKRMYTEKSVKGYVLGKVRGRYVIFIQPGCGDNRTA